jgi:hypothetical protein
MAPSFTYNNPRRGDDDHPDDEGHHPVPPSVHRHVGRPLQPLHSSSLHHQYQQQRQPQQQPQQQRTTATRALATLASKPHAFGGALLSPDHARNLTSDLVLQLTSALSAQASQAAASRGILPPGGERINIFQGSDIADRLLHSTDLGLGGPTTAPPPPPGTPDAKRQLQKRHLPAHVLHLLRNGGGSAIAMSSSSSSSSFVGVPQTPKASSSPIFAPTPGGASSSSPVNASVDQSFVQHYHNHNQQGHSVNPLSLLSTAEALESFASWRTHYTVWITEAWNILKWSEPSAALFWEMATMFHTLYVASLSARGGGSGGAVRELILGYDVDRAVGPFGAVARSTSSQHPGASSTSDARHSSASANTSLDCIPPLFSCNSQSSMGSVRSASADPSSVLDGRSRDQHSHANATPNRGGSGGMKPARHSARELPVWLISMFLLVHCEDEAFLRCTSGDDDRRFADHVENSGGSSSSGDPTLDYAALLHNRSLSPRTRLHASSPVMHENNANCAAFLLRHLRKFVLLCAVPRHALACRALATLAAKGGGGSGGSSRDRSNRNVVHNIDITTILQQHQREHGTIGLNVELTIEELDRLQLVLQAPSGGLIDEPPVAIGEHVLKCLAMEELEAHRKSKSPLPTPNTIRWHMIQNGLVTVSDAERVLQQYLEEELTMAKSELERDSAAMSSSGDVTSRLTKLSLGVSTIRPASPTRPRGVSLTPDSADAAKDGSAYLKELRYLNLRSTTVLLESGQENTFGSGVGNNDCNSGSVTSADQHSQASSTIGHQVVVASAATHHQPTSTSLSLSPVNESGRLHDLHVANCSDMHFYLLQPFEHAFIAACTDCTIVIGAVAGLLHVIDCERTTITSAARRVVVSNSCDVVHYVFTPSPPLLVGDNRGCQFAPYNTYYDGLREDLLATGLAALLRSASCSGSVGGSVAGDSAASPGRGSEAGGRCISPTALPTLQCASNKWKVPVGEWRVWF